MGEIERGLGEYSPTFFTNGGAINPVMTRYTEQSPPIPPILKGRGCYKFLFRGFLYMTLIQQLGFFSYDQYWIYIQDKLHGGGDSLQHPKR